MPDQTNLQYKECDSCSKVTWVDSYPVYTQDHGRRMENFCVFCASSTVISYEESGRYFEMVETIKDVHEVGNILLMAICIATDKDPKDIHERLHAMLNVKDEASDNV